MDVMTSGITAAAALVTAARVAGEGGTVGDVWRALGIGPLEADPRSRSERLPPLLATDELDESLTRAVYLGHRAGAAAPARQQGPQREVSTFLMDEDLVVHGASGESILRLPWFEEEMFVGRQLPDAIEIPTKIRTLAVDSYRQGLRGTTTQYSFVSYGHRFSVDAVPVHDEDGGRPLVLGIAIPCRTAASAAHAAAREADRLLQAAHRAETQAEEYAFRGQRRSAAAALQRSRATRQAAERLQRHADRLAAYGAPPQLTQRELEVLTLASDGCSYAEIAEALVVSAATVKTHLSHCYEKLAVPDKASAVAAALRHGLID